MRNLIFALPLVLLGVASAHAQSTMGSITLTITDPDSALCASGCSATQTGPAAEIHQMLEMYLPVWNAGKPPHPSCAPSCTDKDAVSLLAQMLEAPFLASASAMLGTPATPAPITPLTPQSGQATP